MIAALAAIVPTLMLALGLALATFGVFVLADVLDRAAERERSATTRATARTPSKER